MPFAIPAGEMQRASTRASVTANASVVVVHNLVRYKFAERR